jgi:Tol biopolymer transport system component
MLVQLSPRLVGARFCLTSGRFHNSRDQTAVAPKVFLAAGDIWQLDFARGVRTRLTFRQSPGSYPVWSQDGNPIIFAAGDLEDTHYTKKPRVELKTPTSWSRDGRFLLYHTSSVPKTGSDLWVLPLEGPDLLGTEFYEGNRRRALDCVRFCRIEQG